MAVSETCILFNWTLGRNRFIQYGYSLTSLLPPLVVGLFPYIMGAATAPVAAFRLDAERERRPRNPFEAVEKSCWYVDT